MKRTDLGWILFLAAAVRVVLYLAWSPELGGDAAAYHDLGARLASGEGFVTGEGEPTSWRPPAYPLFLSAVYLITGAVPEAVRWFQLPVDLGSVALTWWLGGRVFGRRAGLVAGALMAVNLGTAAASGRVLSETLFTFWLLASTAALLKAVESAERRRLWAVGAGLLMGAGVLTRGILVFYPIVAGVVLWWTGGRERERGRGGTLVGPLLLVATFLLTLAPWTVRNWRAQGAFVPVASQGGYTLYSSYNPPRGWVFGMMAEDAVAARAAELSEPEGSRYFVRETLRSLAAEPERLPRLELLKVLFHWVPLDWEVLPWYGAFNPTYAFILAFAVLYGVQRFRGRDPPERASWVLWLPVAYVFAMALVFYGSPRMRLPTEPFLAVFAGAGLAARMERRGRRRTLIEAATLLAVLLALTLGIEPLKDLARGWVAGGSP